ncbi:ABC transporter ATP-binding protein [Thermophilibacter provencensis]|uniref:ABC transporter ATP-binding protein n=1 Tax=Thermophilibacter provencensis TaxID=1852386 RepID=A0ABT7V1G8_9ACTN|nr:ABC transporter ATP-binding protein [Thermophilibacter provencensis]MDM8270455.1 ABC transporter ATP-binding protein [Thermophilibacter provencensis]
MAQKNRDYSKRTSMRLLLSLVSPYKALLAAIFVAAICDMMGMLFIPTQLSAMVNVAVNSRDMSALMGHGVAMLAAALVGSGGYITTVFLASKLCAKVGRDLRMKVYDASLAFSGSDFNSFGTGSMITRTLSDANVVQQTLLMSILMIFPVPLACAIAVALAFSTDAVMGWVLLAVTLAVIVICALAVAKSAPIFTRLQGFIDNMNTRLRESITGVRVIRAFGKEGHERARLGETFNDFATNAIRVNIVFALTDSITFFLMNVVEAAIMWVGADRVGAHAMQIGSISALVEYAMLIMMFLMMAQFAILQVPRALACLTRAAAVLSTEPEIENAETPVQLCAHRGEPGDEVARFDHASLRFSDADEDTLHDISFALRRGQTTAIIGNTGSGKSTVAKLLLRFNDVTAGSLTFEGADVRKVSQEELRSRISYVPQKAWLFSGTIAENLRHGDADASTGHLWHALEVAQASFVRELPDGLGTRVAQGGTNFSGGQRQRLAIARALVRDADLYVFDDSFSALDYKTDATLRHALAGELSHAATLIIAQRVSTIHDADQIVVLKDGEVVGLGTHDELMAGCPTYRAIADSQSRGEDAHV